jgi:glycosyltransferase involved in cell wall biosynthesis
MESVPPKYYGGVERVVSYLTEELVKEGHQVTLFASGDSVTKARLEPIRATALRLDDPGDSYLPYHRAAVNIVMEQAQQFDIIHFHMEPLHFPLARQAPCAVLTTLHGRLDLEKVHPLFCAYADLPVVSISNAQRVPLPWLNWQATVYHGIPTNLYTPSDGPRNYLAFLGRIAPEKRPDRAIDIACRAGYNLKIAAKIDPVDEVYFHQIIEPLLNNPLVEFVGEISDAKKGEFLGHANALVFSGDWPEPFGLALIESLACGTPVLALRHGAVAEIIDHGVTGFILDTVEEAVRAVDDIHRLKRSDIRSAFESRFSAERMAQDYVRVYSLLADQQALG